MLDWRDASLYLFPEDLPDYRWAWEFLRRNPEYRKDWKAAVARYLSNTGEFEATADLKGFLEDGGTLIVTGDSEDDPEDPSFYLPVEEAEKWRLRSGMLNPATDDPSYLSFALNYGTVHRMRRGASFRARGPAYPIVEFDLHLPLKPQIEAIGETLERTRKLLKIKPHRASHHRRLWPLYIRLLDADLDKRTPKQMANQLADESATGDIDEKKVWSQLQAARRMMKPDGYISIFLSSPNRKIAPQE